MPRPQSSFRGAFFAPRNLLVSGGHGNVLPASITCAHYTMTEPEDSEKLAALRAAWAAQWPHALALWSKFTRLSEPHWCATVEAAEAEGLTESFAMIRLTDQAVV